MENNKNDTYFQTATMNNREQDDVSVVLRNLPMNSSPFESRSPTTSEPDFPGNTSESFVLVRNDFLPSPIGEHVNLVCDHFAVTRWTSTEWHRQPHAGKSTLFSLLPLAVVVTRRVRGAARYHIRALEESATRRCW